MNPNSLGISLQQRRQRPDKKTNTAKGGENQEKMREDEGVQRDGSGGGCANL